MYYQNKICLIWNIKSILKIYILKEFCPKIKLSPFSCVPEVV